jgi:hypothetical protein
MQTSFRMGILAAPLLMLVACGGGGGGSATDAPGGNDDPVPGGSAAAPLTDAAAGVPVVGELVADCGDTGVGVVDLVVDAIDGVAGDSLPADLPTLDQLLDQAGLAGLPVIGGLIPVDGELESVSGDSLIALVPGASALGDLPALGQLPTVCSSLVGALPSDAFTDPAVLLETLGDPSAALGVIAILDDAGVPVGVILATLPSGLVGGGLGGIPGLPSGTPVPDLNELSPLDPSTVPVLGDLTESLLAVLSGGSVGGLGSLTGLLGALGFLIL